MIVSKYAGEGGCIYQSVKLRTGASHNGTYTPQPSFQQLEDLHSKQVCHFFFHVILWKENVSRGADFNLLVSFHNTQAFPVILVSWYSKLYWGSHIQWCKKMGFDHDFFLTKSWERLLQFAWEMPRTGSCIITFGALLVTWFGEVVDF